MAAVPEGSVAERIAAALARASERFATHPSERPTIAALSRSAGVSRNTLYRFYPEALATIRQWRARSPESATEHARIRHLRAELTRASTLVQHLSALLDHYARAYQEAQDLLSRRERELAELRRSRGSLPTALRRAGLT